MEMELDRAMDQRVYNYTLVQNGKISKGRCIDFRDDDGIADFIDIDTGRIYFVESREVFVEELDDEEALDARQTFVNYSVMELIPDIMYEVGKGV